MRFVITGEWRRNSLLRLIIALFLLYTAGLWVTNALLYFNKMKLTPTSVVEYYRGSEERFTRPRTYQGLLEISHFHLFAMGILILTLTHLVLFVPLPVRLKFWLLARFLRHRPCQRGRRLAGTVRSPGLRLLENCFRSLPSRFRSPC